MVCSSGVEQRCGAGLWHGAWCSTWWIALLLSRAVGRGCCATPDWHGASHAAVDSDHTASCMRWHARAPRMEHDRARGIQSAQYRMQPPGRGRRAAGRRRARASGIRRCASGGARAAAPRQRRSARRRASAPTRPRSRPPPSWRHSARGTPRTAKRPTRAATAKAVSAAAAVAVTLTFAAAEAAAAAAAVVAGTPAA